MPSSIRFKAMEDSGRSVVRSKGSGSEDPDEISGMCFLFLLSLRFHRPSVCWRFANVSVDFDVFGEMNGFGDCMRSFAYITFLEELCCMM